MNYTLKGRLQTTICDTHEKAMADTKIRLYRIQESKNAVTAFTAAQSKELIQVFDAKEIKTREKQLLAETKTDANGNYEFNINSNTLAYDGGTVAIVLYYDEIPEYGQKGTSLPKRFTPFEVLLDVIQPKWRETNEGLIAGWNYSLLNRVWCYILSRLDIWVICGSLVNCKTRSPLGGIEVIAMDDDIISDDFLGSAVTNNNGEFCIYYRSIDFKKTFLSPWINVETTPVFSFDNGPDIYFKFAANGIEFFAENASEAQKPSRKNIGNCLCVDLCLDEDPNRVSRDPITGFYQIGYARKYHPIFNIDAFSGKTKDMLKPNGDPHPEFNDQAFYSNLDLRGSLTKKLNGQPLQYKFEYVKVVSPSVDLSSIPNANWKPVTENNMTANEIATRVTQIFPEWKYTSYVIKGTTGPTVFGAVKKVDMTPNHWIDVPQDSGVSFNDSLIKLVSSSLSSGIVDMSGLIPGNSSGMVLQKNEYFALRMWKREQGNAASETLAGSSRPLAIFNTTYKDVPQGGAWDPFGKSSELGIAALDLQELVDGGSCAKITNSLTANYTASNPNLGSVKLEMFGPGGPHNFESLIETSSGEEFNGQAKYTGADNSIDPNDVSNLPNCAFEVRLTAALNLTNGEHQHHLIRDRVLYCKLPNS
ncbi:MAG: Uncharacterised protein [Formosa sp. Hel1_33_131]|nr:MAG: Uncharacterised protein [Formosa sp. Hel1_33_131]